jgi:type IV secretion system protein VirD4
MYKLCRLLLIGAVLLFAYTLVLVFAGRGWMLVAIVMFLYLKKNRKRLWSHGTARWAMARDLRGKLDSRDGLPLGIIEVKPSIWSLFNPRVSSREACRTCFGYKPMVRLPVTHTLICAPSAGGKTSGVLIPFAQTCPDSMVIVECKGDMAVTRTARKAFGHKVVEISPYSPDSDCLNALNSISADSATAIDDCRDLAKTLVIRTGQENDLHWCDSAELFITAATAFVVYYAPAEDRSLETVRGILSDPEELDAAINVMRQSPAWDGMLARMGASLTHYVERERASALTTVGRMLDFLDSPAIARVTTASSFDPAELRNGKMTVYLTVPPERQKALIPFTRMILGTMFRAIISGGLQEENKIHVLIDDAASLGHMEQLDDALDKYRSYGIRLVLAYQSLGQLKTSWKNGNDATVLANTTNVFFGINDNSTASYISERIGDKTITVNSGGRSTSHSRQASYNVNNSYSVSSSDNFAPQARRLLKPEEIMALNPREAITLSPGMAPISTWLVRYYERDFSNGWFKRSWRATKVLALSLILFVLAAFVAVEVRIKKEQQHAEMVRAAQANCERRCGADGD